MIATCTDADKPELFDYIGDDYGKCLYIFIDLKMYPLDGERFKAWVQRDDSGGIRAVVTEYYGGYQVYSRYADLDSVEIATFLEKQEVSVAFGFQGTMEAVYSHLSGYAKEVGSLARLKNLQSVPNEAAYSASLDEMTDIVELISQDENLGGPYTFDELFTQYEDRKKTGFGRNYVLRDSDTGEIVCHVATNAEVDELAIIAGAITNPKYRGQGYSKGVLAALCRELLNEGKDVFSFFYISAAERMHEGVGFERVGDWVKLVRNKEAE